MLDRIRERLKSYSGEPLVIMEVCGTHTAAIAENGIEDMLSPQIRLVAGPGCPVCVTVASYIDKLIELSEGAVIVTFGDMMRVPGTRLSLRAAAAEGAEVRMIYSPLELLKMASEQPDRRFVFAAVGFETTTPVYAVLMRQLIENNIKNVKLLTALKTMPEVIRNICRSDHTVTGFLAPGHVSVITGHKTFEALAAETGLPFVTAGFGGVQLLSAIYALTRLRGGRSLNLYPSVVTYDGNLRARLETERYFTVCDAAWRGMGIIKDSGMRIRDEYAELDAGSAELYDDRIYTGCRCGEVICGRAAPAECPLFGRICTPESPEGACMVSMEGACYIAYRNGGII